MDGALTKLLAHIAAGGPGAGWILAAYLLFRLHQVTDRQHKANLDTVAVLAVIKTLLLGRNSGGID
jgi:hypothetical protein